MTHPAAMCAIACATEIDAQGDSRPHTSAPFTRRDAASPCSSLPLPARAACTASSYAKAARLRDLRRYRSCSMPVLH
ncbi:hypothetical protein K523DRAFT_326655 [Schizophyllum commune Tattone D]|nr:hypothetical protein K523DRAFT_326655 [Schizophyllum commune Tattone D]